jgi:hypothetical protein
MLQSNAGSFGAGEWSRSVNWGTFYSAPATGAAADLGLFDNTQNNGIVASANGVSLTYNNSSNVRALGLILKPTGVVQIPGLNSSGVVTTDASGNLLVSSSAPVSSITAGSTAASGFTSGHIVGVSGGSVADFGVSGSGTTVALTAAPTFTSFRMLQANAGGFTGGEWSRNSNWGTYYQSPVTGSAGDIGIFDSLGRNGFYALSGTGTVITYDNGASRQSGIFLDTSGNSTFYGIPKPDATNTHTLGTSSLRWSDIYGVLGDFSGAVSIGGALTYGGVTLSNSVTGTGSMVASSSPTVTTPILVGFTDGSSAGAGNVGELISSTVATGSAVSLTNNTVANIASISLTAGDWDVWISAEFKGGATTTVNFAGASLESTNNGFNDATSGFVLMPFNAGTPFNYAGELVLPTAPRRVSVSSTTTYYFNVYCGFGVSTMSAYGGLFARRRR